MRSKGCEPDPVTYNILVKGMCDDGRLDDVIELLDRMPSFGCQPNAFTHNIILQSMCSKWMLRRCSRTC